MFEFVKSLRQRLSSKIVRELFRVRVFVSKLLCKAHIHSTPSWVISSDWGSYRVSYIGTCKSCRKDITKKYWIGDFTGPFWDGLEPNKYTKKRNLEAVVARSIDMFLRDWDERRS